MSTARALSSLRSSPTSEHKSIVAELERLETEIPSWQTALLRLGGTFSDAQWQGAAAGDMYVTIVQRVEQSADSIIDTAALPGRFYTQFQLRGLHCWLAHVRLREEPKESFSILYRELMEHVWHQVELDLTREFAMGYIEMSKHLKNAQLSWHGMCRNLDAAIEDSSPREAVAAVLLRNMYVDDEGDPLVDDTGGVLAASEEGSLVLADYLLAQRDHLRSLPADDVLKGRLTWSPLSSEGAAQA